MTPTNEPSTEPRLTPSEWAHIYKEAEKYDAEITTLTDALTEARAEITTLIAQRDAAEANMQDLGMRRAAAEAEIERLKGLE